MRQVTVTELKNKLSQYLRLVKRGETLEVLERSIPIARIEGIEHTTSSDDALLAQLIRDGIVSRPKQKPSIAWLKTPPLPCKGDAVRVLVEQRGER